MTPHPYIGVTGFTEPRQASQALAHFDPPHGRRLMLGVLASHKSLRGIPMKERWAKQTPSLAQAKTMFDAAASRGALNLVHYSTDEAAHSRDLLDIVSGIGDSLDGFQLNIAWPSPGVLGAFHTLVPGRSRSIVLQVGAAAVVRVGHQAPMLARRLKDYVDLVDHVLIDASGGLGKPLDTGSARQYLRAIRDAGLPFGLGVAGGLGPYTLGPIRELIVEFPNLSWDAQGLLRTAENELDLDFVARYLEASCAIAR